LDKSAKEKAKEMQKKVSKAKQNRKEDEIIIDAKNINIIKEKPKKAPVKQSSKTKKKMQVKAVSKNKKQKKSKSSKPIFIFILIGVITIGSICFILSPIFNIKEIKIENNLKMSREEIINLSEIQLGTNIFLKSKNQIAKNIKKNAYIDTVNISKTFSGEVNIKVTERIATFQIEKDGSFAYINNQGYILEIATEKLNVPIIYGQDTKEITMGKRLIEKDLIKLEQVLKIMESATNNEFSNLITGIRIGTSQDYILELESENKLIHLGDATNLGTRMLYVKAILEHEKGNKGEIFANGDLNKTNVFFSPR